MWVAGVTEAATSLEQFMPQSSSKFAGKVKLNKLNPPVQGGLIQKQPGTWGRALGLPGGQMRVDCAPSLGRYTCDYTLPPVQQG